MRRFTIFLSVVLVLLMTPVAFAGSFVNLIDTVGYSDNTRISTSSGGLRDKTGYVTSGFIELTGEGDVYRTSGVNFNADVEYDRGVAIYQADGTFWVFIDTHASAPTTANGNIGTFSVDADGNLTFVTGSGWSLDGLPRLIRFAGAGVGADLIITKNELIIDTPETEPTEPIETEPPVTVPPATDPVPGLDATADPGAIMGLLGASVTACSTWFVALLDGTGYGGIFLSVFCTRYVITFPCIMLQLGHRQQANMIIIRQI